MFFIFKSRANFQAVGRGFNPRLPLHLLKGLSLTPRPHNGYDSTAARLIGASFSNFFITLRSGWVRMPVLVVMHINSVAGELSTNCRILFRGAQLRYPSPAEHVKRRMAQAYFPQGRAERPPQNICVPQGREARFRRGTAIHQVNDL
jgi:hypothetical protein